MKLSDLKPEEVEVIGDQSASLGSAPKALKLSEFHPDEIENIDIDPSTSPITAATTGLIEGAVPFAGAIAGAGKAAMDAITGVRGPLAPGGKFSDIGDDYRQARDSFTGDARKAADANPGTALAANIAGGITNPLFKGANSLPKVMAASGAQSLGMSDADLTRGEFKGAAIDSGIGMGAGALGYGVGKAIPKLWDGVKYFGKKGFTNLGPTEEAISARLAGKAQPDAKTYSELGEKMSGTLKSLGKQTKELDGVAWQTLSPDQNIPKAYVTNALDESLNSLGVQGKVVGAADKQVSGALNALKEDIAGLSDNVSERDLKSLIKKMDENIDWDDQSRNKLNQVLQNVRMHFDKTLKFRNKSYKTAMEPVAERSNLLDEVKRLFNFRNEPGKGLRPTDTTASKMQSSLKDNKAITQEKLEQLKKFTGDDFENLANDFRMSQQFEKTGAQGSKRTVLGAGVGSLIGTAVSPGVGSAVGGGLGAAAGSTMDQYGGKMVGKMIDSYLKAGNSKAFGKFAPVIQKAAAKGPEALAVVSAVLSDNKEFQAIVGNEKVRMIDPKGKVRLVPRYRIPAALQAGGKLEE